MKKITLQKWYGVWQVDIANIYISGMNSKTLVI